MSKKKKTSSSKSSKAELMKGKLEVSRIGMGFVIVEGLEQDILVKPNDFGKAFHGDTVRVEIIPMRNGKRKEGRVTEVVSRKQTEFTGTLEVNGKIAFFIPDGDRIPDFYISADQMKDAVHGQRVLARLVKWDKNDRKPQGEIIKVIEARDESDLAMRGILTESGFSLEFEDAVIQEANKLEDRITREELRKRKDCRDILTFTIDPVDARDFDDAISIRNLDNGNYEVGVHITDVSHFVQPGTLLDRPPIKGERVFTFPIG